MIGRCPQFVRRRPAAGTLQHRTDTWYDDAGRIVFTAATGLPGVGLPRTAGPEYTSHS